MSFGRLSTFRVALDAMSYEGTFPWAGRSIEDSELAYEDRWFPGWKSFATTAIETLNIGPAAPCPVPIPQESAGLFA